MNILIRKIRGARAAFTLMEVNLAIFIMAVGVLAMTSLYPLGFRESQQSREDVSAAIVANEVLGQLTAVLSSRNITWDEWNNTIEKAVAATPNAWLDYFDYNRNVVKARSTVDGLASDAFTKLASLSKNGSLANPLSDDKYVYGLVVRWGKRLEADGKNSVDSDDHSRVVISFRMARRLNGLMAAPIYYTEVHFQGDQADQGDK